MTDKGSESFSNKDEHEKEPEQGWEQLPQKREGFVMMKCTICQMVFKKGSRWLLRHENSHSLSKSQVVETSVNLTGNSNQSNEHEVLKCISCPAKFTDPKTYHSHTLSTHTVTCPAACGFTSWSARGLSAHLNHCRVQKAERGPPKKKWACGHCKHKPCFLSEKALQEHLRLSHETVVKKLVQNENHQKSMLFCHACPKKFSDRVAYKEHTSTHEKLFCPKCSYLCWSKTGMKRHMTNCVAPKSDANVNCVKNRKVTCDKCYSQFPSFKSMRDHIGFKRVFNRLPKTSERNRERQELQCIMCDTIFKKWKKFQAHEENYHANMHYCSLCKLFFRSKADLESHKLCSLHQEVPGNRINQAGQKNDLETREMMAALSSEDRVDPLLPEADNNGLQSVIKIEIDEVIEC